MGKSKKEKKSETKDASSLKDTTPNQQMSKTFAITESNDDFFASIISMIPRELYKPADDDDEDLNQAKYFKHKKLPMDSDVKKSISKKRLAEKYGKAEVKEDGGDDDEHEDEDTQGGNDDDDANDENENDGESKAGAVGSYDSMETLRERLQKRIATMKESRTSKKRPFEPSSGSKERSNKSQKKDKEKEKEKSHSANKTKGSDPNAAMGSLKDATGGGAGTSSSSSSSSSKKDTSKEDTDVVSSYMDTNGDGDSMDIDFGTITGDSAGGVHDKFAANKGKPGTKKQRLERMLESADNRRERLQQLRNEGTESSKARLKEEHWNDVMKTAEGKSSIDTTKIKKALKRREKDKQKSAQEWGARKKGVEDAERAKIDKRETNLNARKNMGKHKEIVTEDDVKAAGKVGGRNKEKALEQNRQKRPGFEGKSVGGSGGKGQFLNSKEKKKQSRAAE